MALPPILNPGTPFEDYLPFSISHNSFIFINGLCYGEKFEVNFKTDSNDRALHFNPRFNEGQVVRNSELGGGWGDEERHDGFPFYRNQAFELMFHIHDGHFSVSVNGSHFTTYAHRVPKESIRRLEICGDVQIFAVRYQGANPYKYVPVPSGPSYPVFSPPVPFAGNVPGGLYQNRLILISGVPTGNSFAINLQTGPYQGGDIGFHFNVRFNHGGDYNAIVRNSFLGGGWGGEERELSYFPFAIGAPFDITIYAEQDKIKVAVNNQKIIKFNHRIPMHVLDHLSIEGDVVINMIQYL